MLEAQQPAKLKFLAQKSPMDLNPECAYEYDEDGIFCGPIRHHGYALLKGCIEFRFHFFSSKNAFAFSY